MEMVRNQVSVRHLVVLLARDELIACPVLVLNLLCQLCVRYASVEHLGEGSEAGIRSRMTDNMVSPLQRCT